ncbi:MAG: hypothetical protein QOE70_323 [Chthoniobacter sp.]|jgi:uncharacterized membrane protein YkoI|nr:hypothetical protein [Chthoniobacter sp.]
MITRIIITTLSASICLSAFAAEDKEEKATLESIPEAAAKTLKAQAGGEKIKGVSKEKDEGRTVYEASFTKKGRAHDVTVDEAGKLISDEEVIPLEEAPGAVRAAIEKEHPGGKVDKLEKITEDGKVSYEALISGKKKREEIKFDSKGKVLEREDKTGAKKND